VDSPAALRTVTVHRASVDDQEAATTRVANRMCSSTPVSAAVSRM
jgi:hypothetical protein